MKVFERLAEAFGWLQIAASPPLIGLIIGTIIYVNKPDTAGLLIGALIACTGLVVGLVWATRVRKKEGTILFLSRTAGAPELDKPDANE